MQINPSEVTKILKEQIKKFGEKTEVSEVGQVLSVGDGIARVYGLDNVKAGEMVEFLGGINILEGKVLKSNVHVSNEKLYSRGVKFETESTNIRMIPYFSWHNRGNSEMAVWLPIA